MPPYGWFEIQDDGSLLPLDMLGVISSFDGSGNAVYTDLAISNPSGPIDTLGPLAPELRQTAETSTTADLTWNAAPFDGRPDVTSWRVYRDGVLRTTISAPTQTFHDTGLTTSQPYIYEVQGVNSNGVGDKSNQLSVQPGDDTTTTTPFAPTSFTNVGLTSTLATFTWNESADASVLEHGLFEGTTLVKSGIAPTATSYAWSVVPGSQHYQLGVARRNSLGWSPVSNRMNLAVPTGGGLQHDPVMGTDYSTPSYVAPEYYTDWGALRVYQAQTLLEVFNSQPASTPPRVLCYTANWSTGSTASAVETTTRAMLEDFYYGSGSAAHQGCEVHVARYNEETRQFTSGNLPQIVIDHYAAIRRACWTLNGNGTRRFPLASVWVDFTVWGVTGQGAGPRFKPIAQHLDGFSSSMYPPGRFLYDSRSGSNPRPWWTNYNEYVDPVLDVVSDWKATYPNLTQFGCWEIGIPIDKAGPNPPPTGQADVPNLINDGAMGEPTNWGTTIGTSNLGVRPRYFCGGRAALTSTDILHNSTYPLGENMVGYLQYVYNQCDSRGIIMREQLWWNRQDNIGAPNHFFHDNAASVVSGGQTFPAHSGVPGNIGMAQAWHDWVPGSRLADL